MLFTYSVVLYNECCMMRAINPDGPTIKTPEIAEQPDAVPDLNVPLDQDRPPVQTTRYHHNIGKGFYVNIYTRGTPQ